MMFYETPVAVFRSSCFFNSLFRCRAPTDHLKKGDRYDIQFRKFIRRIMGFPPDTKQWHDILHEWNLRVDHWSLASGIRMRENRYQQILSIDAHYELRTL